MPKKKKFLCLKNNGIPIIKTIHKSEIFLQVLDKLPIKYKTFSMKR